MLSDNHAPGIMAQQLQNSSNDKMKRWWQRRKKGEIPCAFGLLALFLAMTIGSPEVYPSNRTAKAVHAGICPPYVCLAFPDQFAAFMFALLGLALFFVATKRGEPPYKKGSLIGVGLTGIMLILFGFNVVQASIAYAHWRGWI